MQTIHIYFQDEAPRIGCGWRTCEVQVGRKWAHLRECAKAVRVKLPLHVYEQLRQREVKVRKRFMPRSTMIVSRSVQASSPGP